LRARGDKPWGKVKHVEKGGDGVTSHLANLRFFDEGIVEESGSVLLLSFVAASAVLALGLLLGGCAGDVEAHLNQLVPTSAGLLSLAASAALAVRAGVVGVLRQRHFDGDLIPAGEVCVSDLGVRQLEGRLVLDAERELGLGELGLAPVPASQGVLLGLENGAVPVLEDLAQALVVLLLKAVELDDARVALEDADLVALGGTTPLRAANVAVIEGECLAAARRLPAEARLGKPTLAALLGEVKVDAVEALPVRVASALGRDR